MARDSRNIRNNPEAPLDGAGRRWLDEPPPRDDYGWLKSLVLWLGIALIFFGMLVYAFAARAHMKQRPDLDHWLMSLYSKDRGACCDSSEAETMADPDWRNASEFKKGECVNSNPRGNESASEAEVVFCVRLQTPETDQWNWWTVPTAAVVELPNRAGPALVWLIWISGKQPYIRCFLPGAGG